MGTLIRKRGKLSRKFNKAGGKHGSKREKSKVRIIKAQLKNLFKKYPERKQQKFVFSKKTLKTGNIYTTRRFTCAKQSDTKITIKKESVECNFDGNRIVNLNNLSQYVGEITKHAAICAIEHPNADSSKFVKLICETKVHGLASVLVAQCQVCQKQFSLSTSETVECDDGDHRFDVNVRAVWAEMVTGGGSTSLNERMGTMGIGQISAHSFKQIEDQVSKWWLEALQQDMAAAAVTEKAHALEVGSYCEGIPAITVVADAGWSKRSHGHSYNAPGT